MHRRSVIWEQDADLPPAPRPSPFVQWAPAGPTDAAGLSRTLGFEVPFAVPGPVDGLLAALFVAALERAQLRPVGAVALLCGVGSAAHESHIAQIRHLAEVAGIRIHREVCDACPCGTSLANRSCWRQVRRLLGSGFAEGVITTDWNTLAPATDQDRALEDLATHHAFLVFTRPGLAAEGGE